MDVLRSCKEFVEFLEEVLVSFWDCFGALFNHKADDVLVADEEIWLFSDSSQVEKALESLRADFVLQVEFEGLEEIGLVLVESELSELSF